MIPENTRVKLDVPAVRASFAADYGQPSSLRCRTRALEQATEILYRILHRTKQRPWLWSKCAGTNTAEISTDPNDDDGLCTLKIPMSCIKEYSPV